jgi:MoxR-like ATPase
MILNELGIFGWSERDENLVLASLLTGDPLLLIGNHGGAKTHLAAELAQAGPIRVFVNPGCPAAWV